MLLVLLAGCAQSPKPFGSVKLPVEGIIREPVRTSDGTILLTSQSEKGGVILRAQLGADATTERAELKADGYATDFDLAAGRGSSPDSRALAVLESCPAGFGEQSPDDEFRQCVGPLKRVSVELDAEGQALASPVVLPADLPQGHLFASDETFVWAGFDSARAIYADGAWRMIETAPPETVRVHNRCASKSSFWVLHGNTGPRSLTGQDNALPIERPGFALYRYDLDGKVDNAWVPVDIPGLRDTPRSELACGDDEAFVTVNNVLISTSAPDEPITEAGNVMALRDNPGRRPVALVDQQEACVAVLPGGELVRRELAGAGKVKLAVCLARLWPSAEGLIAIEQQTAREPKVTAREF
jgi:hypothetical protein